MTVNLICPKCGHAISILCGGTTPRETFAGLLSSYMTCMCGELMQKTGPLYGPTEPISERKE